jgi:hypothetical protein
MSFMFSFEIRDWSRKLCNQQTLRRIPVRSGPDNLVGRLGINPVSDCSTGGSVANRSIICNPHESFTRPACVRDQRDAAAIPVASIVRRRHLTPRLVRMVEN